MTGATGAGKTYLACALGQKACREGYSVLYRRLPPLFQELAVAKGDGRYIRLLAAFERTELIILDDWGMAPLTDEQRRDLFEILEDRYRGRQMSASAPVRIPEGLMNREYDSFHLHNLQPGIVYH